MKTCRQCSINKPLLDFHIHKQMKDGRLNICKVCIRANVTAYREAKLKDPEWLAKERSRCRVKQERYRALGLASKTSNETKNAWRNRNNHKSRAHSQAARAHKIKPNGCSRCTKKTQTLQRHHPDYSKPKEILWLCTKCHGIEHRK